MNNNTKKGTTYKIKFNEYQHNTLKNLQYAKPKVRKLMSIYSYLIKHSENNKVIRSLNKLHEMYVRYHEKVSNRYFYNLVNELVDLKLVDKVDNELFIILEHQEVVQTKVQSENVAQTVENTNVEEKTSTPNINTNSNIYTNTLYTQHNSEIVAPVELVCIAKNMMKDLKVRSVVVTNKVLDKLRKCYNVNRAGAEKYILKVIEEKRVQQEVARANFRNRVALQTNVQAANVGTGFNNFTSRNYSAEQYKAIEDALANRF